MSIRGVKIAKGTPGVSADQGADSISGFVFQHQSLLTGVGVIHTFLNLKNAEAVGITQSNEPLAHYHIREFFRLAGDGTQLFVTAAPADLSYSEVVASVYPRNMLIGAKGKIRQLAFAFNRRNAPEYQNGIDTDLIEAITKGQALYEESFSMFRPCQIVIEGLDVQSVANLPNLREMDALKVTLCIGQDYTYAATLAADLRKHAAVGTLLGSIAKISVNQNIGEVETMDLASTTWEAFSQAGISSHQDIDSIEDYWEALDEKGYVFPISYTGQSGFYWNDEHVCGPVIIDRFGVMNEHSISLGRTSDKASRLLRAEYLPKVKTTQPVDPKTGLLPIGIIKYLEEIGNTVFEDMKTEQEISGGSTTVDPKSDLMTPPKTLNITYSLVPYGQIGEIKGTLNIKQTL